ncbi:MAG TPA: RNA-binding cell elongation regulator Jag/EloR [Gaiellaceae bacterium]|jgi:spoIIIJ-associated protein
MTDDEELSVEASGETVGEAKWAALRELEALDPELDKAAVRFEVLSEGERGLLGVGYTPARVVATASGERRAREERDEGEVAALVRDLVERIADGIGVRCRIDVVEDAESVTATCTGRDLGMLIGRHGQTIDAIQYLANAIVARRAGEARKSVVVDAAGYRERRRELLEATALRAAERARAGERVELEPMSSVERKVVHLRLKDEPGVATASEGAEPNRYVVVFAQQ